MSNRKNETPRRKLVVKTETLRRLQSLGESELEMVAGGEPKPSFAPNGNCCRFML
jgi:hypothetical protein